MKEQCVHLLASTDGGVVLHTSRVLAYKKYSSGQFRYLELSTSYTFFIYCCGFNLSILADQQKTGRNVRDRNTTLFLDKNVYF